MNLQKSPKAPPIIRGSYLAQSQSDRSLNSTPVTMRLPEPHQHTRSSGGRHKKRSSYLAEHRETSFSGSSHSNSEEDNGQFRDPHDDSESESEEENDDDEDDDDSIITGTFGTRLQRFCWALCCACSDCCRCQNSCLKCQCCRSRTKDCHSANELSGVEIENGVLMHDNFSGANSLNKDYSGSCGPCVSWMQRTWKRWIRVRKYIRDTLEYAENGKPNILKI